MKAKLRDWLTDGGPLFPIVSVDRNLDTTIERGATVLDYLAAHAPQQPPAWFVLEPTEPQPRVLGARECLEQHRDWSALSEIDQEYLIDWLRDGTFELNNLKHIGEPAAKLFTESREKAKAWEDAYAVECYFAWRWYYAQMMLRHRPATQN